jgi:pantoate kinase
VRRAIAFCPGHITGFFQAVEHDNVFETGSRGAGFCTELGARTEVWMTDGKGSIEVNINGERAFAPVTEYALRRILKDEPYDINVITVLGLPISQGFGTSAAGALSASLALCSLLDRPSHEGYEAAHESEIMNRTGMGDVSAMFRGGMTFRRKEGLPPLGKVDRFDGDPEVVLCEVGKPIKTSDVLSDEGLRAKINASGRKCLEEFEQDLTVRTFTRLSKRFAVESGVASPEALKAIAAAENFGHASMSMLGNSVFAFGEVDRLEAVLGKFGQTYRTRVDLKLPRLLK